MNILVRNARVEELEALTDIVFRSKQSNGYDSDFMEMCREELRVTPAQLTPNFWVAEAQGLLGCCSLIAEPQTNRGRIASFFVDPNHQRKGVGRALWAQLEQGAHKQGLTYLHLDADPAAVPFYRALGFEITGETPSGSIPGRKLPIMSQILAQE